MHDKDCYNSVAKWLFQLQNTTQRNAREFAILSKLHKYKSKSQRYSYIRQSKLHNTSKKSQRDSYIIQVKKPEIAT
jgi:hypothetical protein